MDGRPTSWIDFWSLICNHLVPVCNTCLSVGSPCLVNWQTGTYLKYEQSIN